MGASRQDVGTTDTLHRSHQWGSDRPISETIAGAIAADADVERASLPPMDRSINPDALEALFDTGADPAAAPGCVTFSYYGYTVVVQSTGRILIRKN